MADDITKTGAADRAQVSAAEGYEVKFFANKHKLSTDQARRLIAEVGNDRGRLDAAAVKLKKR